VTEVQGVYLEEFGSPEAIWALRVKDFPAVVTMDAHGNSLHAAVLEESRQRLKQFV
jgi:fumarate hydratase class I